jgi:hypothetical protein
VEAKFSAPVQTGPRAHPASCTMVTGSFAVVESDRGVTLTPHPLLVPRSNTRVELYLNSPSGPSWPVKRVKHTYAVNNLDSAVSEDCKEMTVPLFDVPPGRLTVGIEEK